MLYGAILKSLNVPGEPTNLEMGEKELGQKFEAHTVSLNVRWG